MLPTGRISLVQAAFPQAASIGLKAVRPMTSEIPPVQNPHDTPSQLLGVVTQFRAALFPKVRDTSVVPDTLETIQMWAGEDLCLTQLLCQKILTYSDQLSTGHEVDWVNTIVEQAVLAHWETNDASVCLLAVREALLSYEPKDSLLILYIQILQRGIIPAIDTPEQAVLVNAGLVSLDDDELRISNAIYARIFDLDWVEQQLPGITRPVRIVRSQAESSHPSSWSKRYSKVMVFACGVAVLVAAGATYLKGAENSRIFSRTKPLAVAEETTSEVKDEQQRAARLSEPAVESSDTDRTLFDQGMENATNGRWLPMLREFCTIPKSSAYFELAQRQFNRWLALYPDDIQTAKEILKAEGNSTCPIAEMADNKTLEPFTN